MSEKIELLIIAIVVGALSGALTSLVLFVIEKIFIEGR